MRVARARSVRLWLVAAGALVAPGCAVISGLDQFSKGDDDASVDAVADQTVNDVATTDAPSSDSSADVTNDSAPEDGGQDATSQDADASSDATASDAACDATNTITNCTACGAACDGTNASTTLCSGTTCQYSCKQGFSNCDAAAPDLNGCECATPLCCAGGSCGVTHDVGINALKYYDCVEAGTYNQTQAAEACTAYSGNVFLCSLANCTNDAGDPLMCGNPDGGGCACWTYGGSATGHVHLSGNSSCFCADTNDPTWN
jgi:hypothetical protein